MKKLSVWMKENGFNQPQAAKALGITQSYLSYILAGKKPSAKLAVEFEARTGIARKHFRPDLFCKTPAK